MNTQSNIFKKIELLRLLADPTRYQILEIISGTPGVCVKEIVCKVKVTQSAVSHQLSKLEAQKLVKCDRKGKTMCYYLEKNSATEKLIKLMQLL